jgi:hypothetical protein
VKDCRHFDAEFAKTFNPPTRLMIDHDAVADNTNLSCANSGRDEVGGFILALMERWVGYCRLECGPRYPPLR